MISWKRLLENDNEAEYMNIIDVDDGKKILKICWNWSQKHKDDGVNKLMGPKKSILLGREYKKTQIYNNLVDLQCKCMRLDTPRIGPIWGFSAVI